MVRSRLIFDMRLLAQSSPPWMQVLPLFCRARCPCRPVQKNCCKVLQFPEPNCVEFRWLPPTAFHNCYAWKRPYSVKPQTEMVRVHDGNCVVVAVARSGRVSPRGRSELLIQIRLN